jgi:hypothetical protein
MIKHTDHLQNLLRNHHHDQHHAAKDNAPLPSMPLFLLNGTHNPIVPPTSVALFQDLYRVTITNPTAMMTEATSSPSLPTLSSTVALHKDKIQHAFDTNTCHVAWLKAGHEIWQERHAYCLEWLDTIVFAAWKALHSEPLEAKNETENSRNNLDANRPVGLPTFQDRAHCRRQNETNHSNDDEDALVLDVHTKKENEQEHALSSWLPAVSALFKSHGIKGIRQELIDRGVTEIPLGNQHVNEVEIYIYIYLL